MKEIMYTLKERLTNKVTLTAICTSAVALVNHIYPIDVPYFTELINLATAFALALGVINNPKTDGLS